MADRAEAPTAASASASAARGQWDRVILHVDMDAFFASVEVLDDPSLKGKPVIVGGAGGRGVVAACTYEARRYGVHSAMPSSVARRLCPTAIFLHGRYHRYVEESRKLRAILESVTPLVEGISIDEAFLDVTGALALLGDGERIARDLRARIADELGLTCSVGVGRTKLVAKLASEAAKPVASRSGVVEGRGVVVVPPAEELAFLHSLPVRALSGVGPATGRRLEELGLQTVGDLATLPTGALERAIGASAGAHLAALSRGEDPRPVVTDQPPKSIGHEETFATDLWDRGDLHARLVRLADASTSAMRGAGLAARTVTVKIKLADFSLLTRSFTLAAPIDASPAVVAVASALLDSVEPDQGIRLLGVSLSGFAVPGASVQLSLDLDTEVPGTDGGPPTASGDEAERLQVVWSSVSAAVDAIRERYGATSVGPASLVGAGGLEARRRGDAQWGPSKPEP
ncbi:MAG: DNA polymerase IV [Acidimicrobiales bacterium]